MGRKPLSQRERAYKVACERIALRIEGKEQQISANPESGTNDPEGSAEVDPRGSNTVGRGGGNARNNIGPNENDNKKVEFDNKLHIRWIEAAGCKPIFTNNAPPVTATPPSGILKRRPEHPVSSAPKILAEFEHGNPALVETFLTDDPRLQDCNDWKQSICTPKIDGAVILVDGLPNPIEIPISERRFLSARRVLKLVYSELMKNVESRIWWRSIERWRRKEIAKAWMNRVQTEHNLKVGILVPSPPLKLVDYLLENVVFDGFSFVMIDASGRTWLKMHTKTVQCS
ncbi:uncharacterized protein EV420DRAFT_995340 [Desarmillaria tabescens]|uniref:DUF6699 domain-containing protein n=1 Tax=Armillaria tabescens TaxID=1929756 RepID=A0AA39MSI7_ARMTA|nr:uncharacterized protein EV420DRAFT_995340 [Desarmillaria tabescens]KAK0444633.1 hypothetical protein EV420DRAFT_995340 [Desarmillaria tabescens]